METTTGPTPPRPRPRVRRRLVPAGNVLIVLLVCLILWSLLAASSLEQAAETSSLGARRTAALVVLRPLAALNRLLGLDHVTGTVERTVGRAAGTGAEAGLPPPPEPLPELPEEENGSHTQPSGPIPASEPLPRAGPGDRLRLVVVGDSLSIGLSNWLGAGLDPRLSVVVGQGRLSSGLTRPDYFDWPKQMGRIVRDFQPDVVVVMLGSNDTQAMRYPDGRVVPPGTRDWALAYREQVARLLRAAAARGAHVALVGLPPMRDGFRQRSAITLNGHFEKVADLNDSSDFIDIFEDFADRRGGYAAYLRNDQGRVQLIRGADGIHFSSTGYEMLANQVIAHMRNRWGLDPRALE
jgi:hypothetical protein